MSHEYDVTISRTITVRVQVNGDQQEPEQLACENAHAFWHDASLTRAQTGATRMHIIARSQVVTAADIAEPRADRAAHIRQLLGIIGADARQDAVRPDDITELSGLVLGLLGDDQPVIMLTAGMVQRLRHAAGELAVQLDDPEGTCAYFVRDAVDSLLDAVAGVLLGPPPRHLA